MRASNLFLLGLLALFLSNAQASQAGYDRYYTTRSAAGSACNADLTSGYSCRAFGNVDVPTGRYELSSSYVFKGHYYWNTGGCPVAQYEYPDNSCSTTPPPYTDAECQATEFTAYIPINLTAGSAPKNANLNGCYFSLKYNLPTDNDVEKNCKFNPSTPNIIVCPTTATGLNATTDPDSTDFTDIVPIGDYTNESGGEKVTSTSSTPVTTLADTPAVGDTTETSSTTETTTTARGDKVVNDENGVSINTDFGNTETKNIGTATITNADGTKTITITEDYNSGARTKKTTEIDSDGNVTESEEVIPPKTGQTVTTNITNNDGSTSTTVNNTGSGGDGKLDKGIEAGNCSPGEECKVTIDESNIDAAEALRRISNSEAKLAGERSDFNTDFAKDGEGDYGLGGVSNFSGDYFSNRYLDLPSSTCSGSINTTIFGRPFIIEPCDKLQPLRDVLAWVFYILTLFTCLKILLSTKSI